MSDNKTNNQNKVLSVKNLRVSFWTNNGTVKAVRGVSFDLYRGRTLAIVGESGSGKSQTSRAIMGILAPNKIIEEGEILYDGKDILRLREEDLCDIRGSRIAMIFQDPMSSLNPIMRCGKQITEAMMLKKKATIADAKKRYSLIKKTLLAEDPTLKEAFEKAEKEGSFESAAFVSAARGAVRKNEEAILAAAKAVKELLTPLRADVYFDENADKLPELQKHIREIGLKVKAVENHLDEKKDDAVYTFVVTLSYLISEFKKAVKREVAAAKAKEKAEKREAKDAAMSEEKLRQRAVQERAWASEIDVSHQAVVRKAAAYVDAFLAHIEEEYINKAINLEKKTNLLVDLLDRSLQASKMKIDKAELKQKAIDLLTEVGIKDAEKRINQYPFEFSGGMRQRIVIAIALSSEPEVLICDEPTTALDVTIQAQILDLINALKKKHNLSVIFITHNLGVVANMADDIAIMYAGKIVEYGTADDIFYHPAHPYTWALLSSMPDLETRERLDAIPGTPPNMIIPPKGDAFAARNKYAMQIDFEEQPPFFTISPTHQAATWLLDERAPKIDPPKSVTERIARFEKLNASLEAKNKEAVEEKAEEKEDA